MEEMIENHGDGYGFFMERLTSFIERLLAGEKDGAPAFETLGTLFAPVAFERLPEQLQTLLGANAAEQARLIGIRTAELHLALASGAGSPGTSSKDFKPEPFSLHYQRSLFASMQSLVRETFEGLARNKQALPATLKERLDRILAYRPELLTTLKKIYASKMDTLKIRIHGNYHLGQILLTGRDLVISDYSGDPSLSFSERRLKRSPAVDLASMVASFYDIAFEAFLNSQQLHEDDVKRLLPMAALWAHYLSGCFIGAYREGTRGTGLLPGGDADFETLLQYYLVQKAMTVFNGYLKKDPKRLVIPQTMLREVLRPQGQAEGAPAVIGEGKVVRAADAVPHQ
jgi:maltose alpha-D-glucosyltransferase/alpha-amylase